MILSGGTNIRGVAEKYIRQSYPDYDICTRNKGRNIKNRQMLEANEMKVPRKIVDKTKVE